MKIRDYEKNSLIMLLIVINYLIILIIFYLSLSIKEYTYEYIIGNVINDRYIILNIDKNKRKIIYKNRILFINNRKVRYIIEEEIYDKVNKNYRITLKTEKKIKDKSVITCSIKDRKYSLITLFYKLLEGDKN